MSDRPELAKDIPQAWRSRVAQSNDSLNAEPPWWNGVGDAQLADLQRSALSSSREVARRALLWQQAERRVEQSKLDATLKPSLRLSATSGPNKPQSIGGISAYSASAGATLAIDASGGLSQTTLANQADADSAKIDMDSARWRVSALLAESYWGIAAIDVKIPLVLEQQKNATQMLDIAKLRLKSGKALPSEVTLAVSALEDSAKALAELAASRESKQMAIALLLDVAPGAYRLQSASFPQSFPPEPRLEPPVRVLKRRFDVSQARNAVDAALYRLGAADASRYPQLSFSAGVTSDARTLKEWLSQPLASLVGNLVIPMVDWKRLDLSVSSAKTELELAALMLRDQIQKAVVEIESLYSDRERQIVATAAARARSADAGQTEKIARTRFLSGSGGLLEYLKAKDALLSADQNYVDQHLKLWLNYVAIHQAVGADI
jgi:outer membrane protein TolC